jgi:hypothetical protein
MRYSQISAPPHQAQLRWRLCEPPRIFLRPFDDLLALHLPLPLPIVPFLCLFHPQLQLPDPLNQVFPAWLLLVATQAGDLLGVHLLFLHFCEVV